MWMKTASARLNFVFEAFTIKSWTLSVYRGVTPSLHEGALPLLDIFLINSVNYNKHMIKNCSLFLCPALRDAFRDLSCLQAEPQWCAACTGCHLQFMSLASIPLVKPCWRPRGAKQTRCWGDINCLWHSAAIGCTSLLHTITFIISSMDRPAACYLASLLRVPGSYRRYTRPTYAASPGASAGGAELWPGFTDSGSWTEEESQIWAVMSSSSPGEHEVSPEWGEGSNSISHVTPMETRRRLNELPVERTSGFPSTTSINIFILIIIIITHM